MSRPPSRIAAILLLLLGVPLLLAGCGGGGGWGGSGVTDVAPGSCTPGDGPAITVSGTVRYERLSLSMAGLTPPLVSPPARFVDVEVHTAGGGVCFVRGRTDATGNYSITLNPNVGSTLEVVALSRTSADPARSLAVHDDDPPYSNGHDDATVFRFTSAPIASDASATVNLTVPYASGPANRPSIGFALLDTALRCWDRVEAALGADLPPLHIYCRLGNNGVLGSSYYSHSARAVAILGGAAGLPDGSDTDYFDDAVVSHEFCHFVDRVVSYSMSRGGWHYGPEIEPNFAWSEGMATGMGCLLIENPFYIDTTTTWGGISFGWSVENVPHSAPYWADPPGIGGEFTVSEILWDLVDGGAGPADSDGDGASVPLADVYAAIDGFDPATDAPHIGLLLERLEGLSSAIDAIGLNALLVGGGGVEDQGIRYPLTRAEDVWPKTIAVGGSDSGTLDSTDPNSNRSRGITTTAWYRLVLAAPALIDIQLTITPIAGSGDNLDLYLTSNSDVNNPIALSAKPGDASESINVSLSAGAYMIRVDSWQGAGDNTGVANHASYVLTVEN